MLCSFQVPIIDLRSFVAGEAPLTRPDWVIPEVDRDFLRTFGALRSRPLGALQGWVGEGIICRASRALTFPEGLVSTRFGYSIWRVWGVNKTFFHDGAVTAKFEVSYKITRNVGNGGSINGLVDEMLSRPVRLPGHSDTRPWLLGEAGPAIAAKFHYASISSEQRAKALTPGLVKAGRPSIIIQQESRRAANIPPFAREFELPVQYEDAAFGLKSHRSGIRVFYWQVKFRGQTAPVFFVQHDKAHSQQARNLRIFLGRMWTEIECLAGCLRAISRGTLGVRPEDENSDMLQGYVNEAVKRIKRLGTSSSKIVGQDIYGLGYSVFEAFNDAEITRLDRALERMKFRPNVARAVKSLSRGETPLNVIFMSVNGGLQLKQDIKFGDGSQFNQIQGNAHVYEIKGPDNRKQTSIVNSRLTALSADLETLLLEATKTGAIPVDAKELVTAKSIVEEAKKPNPDTSKIIGALGTIDGALSHVSGIGEKIHAITDLIKGYL